MVNSAMRGLVAILLLGLGACRPADEYAGNDADGDGFASVAHGGSDCDDANVAVSPEAGELCNDVDDDCDGLIDEDPVDGSVWYADIDGDGYGGTEQLLSCDSVPPAGYRAATSDCNDFDASVHPDAPDLCNDVDDDCDADVDEDGPVWYADLDGDGFGDPAAAQIACVQPSQHVADDTDCDDARSVARPGASETCNLLDDDCDGIADNDPVDGHTFWLDIDDDGFGDPASAAVACSLPTKHAVNSDDCDDSLAEVNPLADEVCNDGLDNDCDGGPGSCHLPGRIDLHTLDAAAWWGGVGHRLGWSVAGGADFNGDGHLDVALSAIGAGGGTGQTETGSVTVMTWDELEPASALANIDGHHAGLRAGRHVGFVRDTNLDGADELVITAPSENAVDPESGAIYLIAGGSTATLTDAADLVVSGALGDGLGSSLDSHSDLDGDGVTDLVLGASEGWTSAGRRAGLWMVSGDLRGQHHIDNAGVGIEYPVDSFREQPAVATGDVDGDGLADLVVGSPEIGQGGCISVLPGPISASISLDDASVVLTGDEDGGLGTALAVAGDLDGDGLADLAAAARWGDSLDGESGVVYAVFGGPTLSGAPIGDVAAARWTDTAGVTGHRLAAAGDVNGDGMDDLLVGSWNHHDPSLQDGEGAGAAWLMLGPVGGDGPLDDAGDTRLQRGEGDWCGRSVAAAGDVDGDGLDDVLAACVSAGTLGQEQGAVWLVHGVGL